MHGQTRPALPSALLLGIAALTLAGSAHAESLLPTPVTWTSTNEVYAFTGTLVRQAGVGWTAGASSQQVIEGGKGYVSFSTSATSGYKMAGLSNSDDSRSFDDIDYAFYLMDGGYLMIFEKGLPVGTFGTYQAGDSFRIEVEDGKVHYRKGADIIHTSSAPPVYPLALDTSLYSEGATITEAAVRACPADDELCLPIEMWKNVRFTQASNVRLSRVLYTGTAWNAGASSIFEISEGNGFVELRAGEVNTHKMAGLGHSDDNQSFTDIEYAFHLRGDGLVGIYESGSLQGVFGSYEPSDTFRVEVMSGQVRYRKNGKVIHTSLTPPDYPLALDTSLYSEGATIESPAIYQCDDGETDHDCTPEDIWKNARFTEVDGNTLTRVQLTGVGWTAGASSVEEIPSGYDGVVEITTNEANLAKMAGLGHSDDNQSYTDIDYAFYLRADGYFDIYESGYYQGTFGTYGVYDSFTVEVFNGQVRYRHNGSVIHTSATPPAYPLAFDTSLLHEGATVSGYIASCVGCLTGEAWKNVRYAVATDDTLTRTPFAPWWWSSGASSVAEIAHGDGFAEFSTLEANTIKMAGLGRSDDSADYTDIEYAFYLQGDGYLSIYESGQPRGTVGTYAAGDVLRVEVYNGQVRYLKNGVVLYTSSTPPQYPLALDTSFLSDGATITDFVVQD